MKRIMALLKCMSIFSGLLYKNMDVKDKNNLLTYSSCALNNVLWLNSPLHFHEIILHKSYILYCILWFILYSKSARQIAQRRIHWCITVQLILSCCIVRKCKHIGTWIPILSHYNQVEYLLARHVHILHEEYYTY